MDTCIVALTAVRTTELSRSFIQGYRFFLGGAGEQIGIFAGFCRLQGGNLQFPGKVSPLPWEQKPD